ncbi:methyltransferase [Campylobacter sp. MIT 21-1685]|uniref:methyltransferase n=1 Tax=unclassified Campylobacter TaxID=2593542 RepID=UPI00224A557C|nr:MULTISPECIES: methyltransferase [unclassified Campylobacter]MCX2683045.1 methyltransferase [Campylobacter sp. MIT 21-1684]MCX2751327.1 methyltransferase [Campylobacter sp. MIT 21-1682]MCX2807526.1 methyltransferase [Campylobacter sp. MIT 21-1685]
MKNYAFNFLKAKNTYEQHSFIQNQMAKQLINLIKKQKLEKIKKIFEFGCGQGKFTTMLIKTLDFESFVCNDINDYQIDFKDKRILFECFDMNELAKHNLRHQKFDLITSNATLQWLNLKTILPSLSEMLLPQGLLLLSSFGKRNLEQITQSTGLSLKYLTPKELKKEMSKYFTLLHLSEQNIQIQFSSTLELFRHLKLSGVNSLGHFFLGKQFLKNFEQNFHNKLNYNPVFLLCQKK